MKKGFAKILQYGFWISFFGLTIANIYVFGRGVKLSNEIHHFESELTKIKKENVELETSLYKRNSLQYAASISAELDFVKKAKPLYVGESGFAKR
jgi:hypothetical protein